MFTVKTIITCKVMEKIAASILKMPAWGNEPVTEGDDNRYERGALEYLKLHDGIYRGLVALQSALLKNYDDGAEFVMSQRTLDTILETKDDCGNSIYGTYSTYPASGILGKRVSTNGASNYIIYGDFREILMLGDDAIITSFQAFKILDLNT